MLFDAAATGIQVCAVQLCVLRMKVEVATGIMPRSQPGMRYR